MDIVAHAEGLITRPREESGIIAGEPSDTASLFKNYVIPVSAIPAVAGSIGFAGFAAAVPGLSVGGLLAQSVVSYILGLAAVRVFGKVVQAPAMELAAHSPTAMWLAGAFALVPPLAILTVLGLYGLCILQ